MRCKLFTAGTAAAVTRRRDNGRRGPRGAAGRAWFRNELNLNARLPGAAASRFSSGRLLRQEQTVAEPRRRCGRDRPDTSPTRKQRRANVNNKRRRLFGPENFARCSTSVINRAAAIPRSRRYQAGRAAVIGKRNGETGSFPSG